MEVTSIITSVIVLPARFELALRGSLNHCLCRWATEAYSLYGDPSLDVRWRSLATRVLAAGFEPALYGF